MFSRLLPLLRRWFDTSATAEVATREGSADRIDLPRVIPFVLLHGLCLGVLWVGWSWFAVATAVLLYVVRMFAVTAFYHRYFSHRAFETGRLTQFVFAVLGNSAAQRGPLWWAAHHRHHHLHSDEEDDAHSPRQHGILWAHMLWFLTPRNFPTQTRLVKDFMRYPELRFIDRFDIVVPALLFAALFGLGELLGLLAPGLGTSGWQLMVWGGAISTVAVFHGTSCINSLAHVIGRRRFETGDDSRNSLALALITLGEGWHNNHHHYSICARQGFYWYEFDPTYYGLRVMRRLGLIHNLRELPARVLDEHHARQNG